ncbi:MAG TPA: DUF6265 family protein [Flavisolibacter sp.]|nr:DUF6265 family protein [Flavisolibacter sp.]
MKPFRLLLLLLCAGCFANAQFSHSDFARLKNLTGRWEMQTAKGKLVEEWSKLNDSLFQSTSYRVQKGDTTLEEKAELRFSGGRISFVATVANQNDEQPVVFALKKIEGNQFVFENAAHDFPKKIIYHPGDRTLDVTISGQTAAGFREVPFHFQRK